MLDLSSKMFWAIPLSVFVAGFLASPHCALMCGPLAFAFAPTKRSALLYQLGRMTSYTLIGAAAGFVGAEFVEQVSGRILFATIALAALTMFLFTLGYLALRGQNGNHFFMPKILSRLSTKLLKQARQSRRLSPLLPFIAGATTILLPCGHLFGFILGASTTANVYSGAAFMFVFWLSTVPSLLLGPIFASRLLPKILPTRSPRVASLLFIFAGLVSIASFANNLSRLKSETQKHTEMRIDHEKPKSHHCH